MSQAQQAAAELTLGRKWPDRREYADRRVVDARVDVDLTHAWLGAMDRRHQERRQFTGEPVTDHGKLSAR